MSEPAYTLRLEPREAYLYAHVSGPDDTFEVSIAYWSEIAAACHAGGVARLLVEEAFDGNAEPTEMEDVVDGLLQMGFENIRVAFVDATEEASLLVGAEIRVLRAGLVGRVFRRVDEAERWLLSEPPAGEPTDAGVAAVRPD